MSIEIEWLGEIQQVTVTRNQSVISALRWLIPHVSDALPIRGFPDMIGTYKNECPRQTIVVMREVPEEVQHYRCDDEGRDQLCTTEKMEWYEGVMSWLDPISRHDVGDVSGSNVRRV